MERWAITMKVTALELNGRGLTATEAAAGQVAGGIRLWDPC